MRTVKLAIGRIWIYLSLYVVEPAQGKEFEGQPWSLAKAQRNQVEIGAHLTW